MDFKNQTVVIIGDISGRDRRQQKPPKRKDALTIIVGRISENFTPPCIIGLPMHWANSGCRLRKKSGPFLWVNMDGPFIDKILVRDLANADDKKE